MLDPDSLDRPADAGGAAVSRETAAPPVVVPAAAASVFGPALPRAEQYAHLLATAGVTRGLIGPREVPRLWERHLLNCAALRHLVPAEATVVDIGSGAGLPGIPLSLARPDLEVTLVEPLERRYRFLREALELLELGDRCRVVRARAEEVRGEVSGQVLTARAVAPLDRLAAWTLPLVQPGGVVLAIKGQSAEEEVEASWPTLQRWGLTEKPAVVRCDTGIEDSGLTVVVVQRGSAPLRIVTGQSGQPQGRRAAGGVQGVGKSRGSGPAQKGRRGRGSGAGRGR